MTKKKFKQVRLDDSQTNVNLGIYGGERKVIGIRCDENLYLRFKPLSKSIFGSVCRAIESYMATIIAIHESRQVNFCNTSERAIEIGTLKIERNLRSRRKLVVEEETEVSQTVSCSYCHKPAVAVFERSDGLQAYTCEVHKNFMGIQPDWKIVKTVEQTVRNIPKGI